MLNLHLVLTQALGQAVRWGILSSTLLVNVRTLTSARLSSMGILVAAIVIVIIALGLFVWVLNLMGRTKSAFKLQDRCAYCQRKLKASLVAKGYAPYCDSCGWLQPWVKGAE